MRTVPVQIRLTPAERELARERARAVGRSMSEIAREALLGRAAPKNGRGAAAPEKVFGLPVELDAAVPPDGFEVRAAELEQGGIAMERIASSGSAASTPTGDGGSFGSGAGGLPPEKAPVPVFRCPAVDASGPCGFRARSPRVACSVHGRKVVPA